MAEPRAQTERAAAWPTWPDASVLALAHLATALLFVLDRAPGTAAARTGFPVDDAWIHLVYARSFGQLHGFAYNPGVQEAGATSPLWAVLLAPLTWLLPLGVPVLVLGVKLLGTLLAWLGSLIAYRLAARWTGSRASGLAAGLLLALDPALTFAKVSGMEVQLAGLLALWALSSLDDRHTRRAGLALGLLPLARPEQAVLWLPATAFLVHQFVRNRAPLRDWLWAFLPGLVGLGAWAAFCWSVSGHPLPNTFYAKHAVQVGAPLADLGVVFGPLLSSLPWAFAGSGLVWLGLGLWQVRHARVAWLIPPYVLLFLLGIAWAHDLSQWQPFYWNRYFQPLLPVLLLPLGIGLGFGLDSAGRWWRGALDRNNVGAPRPYDPWQVRVRGPGAVHAAKVSCSSRAHTTHGHLLDKLKAIAALACVALCVATVPQRLSGRAALYARNCQNIEEMQVGLGVWLRDHVPEGQWIASQDAGALRFFSERPLVDLVGLNDHEVLAGRRLAVLRRHDVRWFIANPYFLKIGSNPRFRPVHMAEAKDYSLCDCPDQHRMFVYEQTRPAPGAP